MSAKYWRERIAASMAERRAYEAYWLACLEAFLA